MKTKGFSQKESGVALVMAMMIVALVAVVAVEISWRFELSISRSGNRWHGMQAKAYLEGAEHLAMMILMEDTETRENSSSDHLGEPWAQETEPFPTDHGWVAGKIEDAHGRFNLNAMVPDPDKCPDGKDRTRSGFCSPAETECGKYTVAQRLFVRLLQTIDLADTQAGETVNNEEGEGRATTADSADEEPVFLELNEAEAIAEAVIDWLDEDSEISGFGGAESDYYEQLVPPTSIANGPMVSVSELQVLQGMRPEIYNKLIDFVVALPKEELNRINLNTASVNVLQTLTPVQNCDLRPLNLEDAQAISDFIRENEFEKMDDLVDSPDLPSIWQSGAGGDGAALAIDQEMIDIGQSTYFLFFSETAVGEDHIRRGSSLIKRVTDQSSNESGTQIEVVRRTDANF